MHAPSLKRTTFCGTLDYLAPEVVEPDMPAAKSAKSTSADVWGLGILLYEFVVGRAPFEGSDTLATYRKIRSEKVCCSSVQLWICSGFEFILKWVPQLTEFVVVWRVWFRGICGVYRYELPLWGRAGISAAPAAISSPIITSKPGAHFLASSTVFLDKDGRSSPPLSNHGSGSPLVARQFRLEGASCGPWGAQVRGVLAETVRVGSVSPSKLA